MSVKTTHNVTRKFAIKAIKRKIREIEDLSDKQLETLLEDVLGNDYYNFWIVRKKNLKDNGFYLNDLSNLPERNDTW